MKTAIKSPKQPKARYFTDGEYFWKCDTHGIRVRRAEATSWSPSCFSCVRALEVSDNLKETGAREGEIQ